MCKTAFGTPHAHELRITLAILYSVSQPLTSLRKIFMTQPSWGCSEIGGVRQDLCAGLGGEAGLQGAVVPLSQSTGAVDPASLGTCPAFPGLVVLCSPRLQETGPDVKERGNSLPFNNRELGCDQNLSETKKSPLPFAQFLYRSAAEQRRPGLK